MLIHLTRREETLVQILGEGRVRALKPYGAAYNVESLSRSQAVVCLSEMGALESLSRLAGRHGTYGLGFRRSWLQRQGAAPVWYVTRGGAVQQQIFEAVRSRGFQAKPDPGDLIWALTPFIDYPQDSDEAETRYDWRWEREWRVRGAITFQPDDVSLVFAPEARHLQFRQWWEREVLQGSPGLIPPVVDAHWPRSRQKLSIHHGPQRAGAARRAEEATSGYAPTPGFDVEVASRVPLDHERIARADELRAWLDELAPGWGSLDD